MTNDANAPVKNPGVAAVLSFLIPGARAVLQRRVPSRPLLADHHAGLLDRHGRHVRLAIPHPRQHHRLPSGVAQEPARARPPRLNSISSPGWPRDARGIFGTIAPCDALPAASAARRRAPRRGSGTGLDGARAGSDGPLPDAPPLRHERPSGQREACGRLPEKGAGGGRHPGADLRYPIGPATDVEDSPTGFAAHSDQERILESEFYRFVRCHYDAVADLARSR